MLNELAPTPTEPDSDGDQWRYDEAQIDGGFCGCEFPRLWPPRWHGEAVGDGA